MMKIQSTDNLKDAGSHALAHRETPCTEAEYIMRVRAAAKRYTTNMRKAHMAGLDACEVCGKGIKDETSKTMIAGCPVGPECAKKLAKLGYTW